MKSVVKTIRGEGGGWEDNREGPTLTPHTPGSQSFVSGRIMLFEKVENIHFSASRGKKIAGLNKTSSMYRLPPDFLEMLQNEFKMLLLICST